MPSKYRGKERKGGEMKIMTAITINAFLITACCLPLAAAKNFEPSAFENYPLPSVINPDHEDGTWGEPHDDLIAKIWTEKDKFALGEPIVVYYIVKNISHEDIVMWLSGFWPNNLIILTNPDGEQITSDDAGLGFDPGGDRDKNVRWPMKPGDINTILPNYNIGNFFDIKKPGKYSVQYLYEEYGGWEGQLFSNILHFEIIDRLDDGHLQTP